MGQAGADHDEGRGVLAQFVTRPADRGDVPRAEVLHLVDEQRDAHPHVAGEPGGVDQQLDEIDLEVPGVGAPLDGGGVDAGLPPFAHALVRGRPQRERLQHAEEVLDRFGVRVGRSDLTHGHVQRRRQRPAQVLIGPGLDLAGAPAPRDRRGAKLIEQDRLADAAQPGEHDAAFGSAAGDPFEHHVEGVELLRPAGELGRTLPRAGSVRVADRVHRSMVTASRTDASLLPPRVADAGIRIIDFDIRLQ